MTKDFIVHFLIMGPNFHWLTILPYGLGVIKTHISSIRFLLIKSRYETEAHDLEKAAREYAEVDRQEDSLVGMIALVNASERNKIVTIAMDVFNP